MKIRENGRNHDVEVLALSWVDGKRQHYVVPYKGYNGIIVIESDQCEVTNPEISEKFIFQISDYGNDMFLHWAVYQDNLIYGMIDHEKGAMEEFYKRINQSNK